MSNPLTTRERSALGQTQRKHLRRVDQAVWKRSARTADPLKLLAASMTGRVPELIPIKYERMAASPFGYFRGAVPVMAADLALGANTAIHAQLCGDAHVRNLGAFAAPDGRLVFDINDFDETMPGPFEWDVKRMATSLILAGREAGGRNAHCREAAAVFLDRYRAIMHAFTRMPILEVARFQVHRLHSNQPISLILRAAELATPMHTLESLTLPSKAASAKAVKSSLPPDGRYRTFKVLPPVLAPVTGDTARQVLESLTTYTESLLPERRHFLAQYRPLDVAMKVVGTGSVGLRDYCVYLQGNGVRDPLFLQIKEEAESAYAPYLDPAHAAYHQGRRVVEGQRAMQLQSDPFLGWTTIEGRDFLVRQLNDHKATVQPEELKGTGLLEYATVCGEMLARGHARSGDCAMIAGYLGASARFDDAIVAFADSYADQTERDWRQLADSRRAPQLRKPAAGPHKHVKKKKAAR
jgi:uncharacterized protein (DUF2252 family)